MQLSRSSKTATIDKAILTIIRNSKSILSDTINHLEGTQLLLGRYGGPEGAKANQIISELKNTIAALAPMVEQKAGEEPLRTKEEKANLSKQYSPVPKAQAGKQAIRDIDSLLKMASIPSEARLSLEKAKKNMSTLVLMTYY